MDNNQPKAEEFVPVNHDNSIVHLTDTSQDDANYNPLPVLNEAAKN